MSESNDANDRPTPERAPDGEPDADAMPSGRTSGKVRIWIGGALFLMAAIVTFVAGDDNRWVSIPAAVIAAVALVDFLSVRQRRRTRSE